MNRVTNSIGMEFIQVPAGEFLMGCSKADAFCDEDEKPEHEVEIRKSFYMAVTEVTNREFMLFIKETSYKTEAEKIHSTNTFRSCYTHLPKPDTPVICISYNDAKAFADWLSEKEKVRYRLPKEAEWEYVARTDLITPYSWGFEFEEGFAWYKKNSGGNPHPVKQMKPNFWGFYDMSGNIWEWCEDNYDKDAYKPAKERKQTNQSAPKVLRGGSWFDAHVMLRVSVREFAPPETIESHYGFRLIREDL